ncbi:unnamed protein product [Cuscuta epithymum]|uniref:Exocyst subunit Exo70 family protein n=1 Tax=Cuscuta epithymum TaxID=186058 RepID=A0AAV0FAS1_9ASTE|nr:unnamed protein product [Cuscuta epithymum]
MEKNSDEKNNNLDTNDNKNAQINGDQDNGHELPDTIQHFIKIIESRIARSGEMRTKMGRMTEDDSFFYEAVMRLSTYIRSAEDKNKQSADMKQSSPTEMILQRAATFMEEELRVLLEESGHNDDGATEGEDAYEPFSPEVVTRMNRIATVMISGGYETECCQVYSICRHNAFLKDMRRLGYEKIESDDIEKMSWDSLEGEITRWVRVVKSCYEVLFIGERRLAEVVFSEHPLISRDLFRNLARAMVIRLLDFVEMIARTKCSAEQLFKFLDMYETIHGLIPAISDGCLVDSEHEITSEILVAGDRIGEACVKIFCDLENSIKNDVARNPVPGGAVHPLTRYVMNYLINACDFRPTLERIFQKHANSTGECETSSFSAQLLNTMDLLDKNLEAKSNLYKDLSLRVIFLMNNGRYILQKIKGSPEIHEAMGDTSYRRRSTVVRQYHKNYQRETWGKVLQILKHDGLLQNGKVNKAALKERFKSFSNMMDEIHKTQSTWVVNDEQLQSELRVSISAVIIPAYRAFLAKFKQHLDGSKHVDRYIKYQSDDIETLIEGLFDGNPTSMNKSRKN